VSERDYSEHENTLPLQSSDADVPLSPGAVVAENYKVERLIGSGGMGNVYLVEQIFLGKRFALKLLSKHHHAPAAVLRFQQEARTTAQLRHANLVEVHDYGVQGCDQPFLVMDYIEGITLSQILKEKGSLSLDYVIALALEVTQGLQYAHSKGVVHRDIKPGNILVLNAELVPVAGSVKIVDFGIAKLSQQEQGEIQELTKTGEIFGSPIYMSPEQCQGTVVDGRADIYSLGCVLFECLTGSPPFLGQNAMSTMVKRLTDDPPTLKEASLGKDYPESVESLVHKMLAVDPDKRYQTFDDVITELKQLQNRQGERLQVVQRSSGRRSPLPFRALMKNISIVIVTALVSSAATALVDRKFIFASEFNADTAYRTEQKRIAELADKRSAAKYLVDYKEAKRYPFREIQGQGEFRKEVLIFPNKCGKVSFGSPMSKMQEAFGPIETHGQLVNLFLSEEAAADPQTLQNLLDVNFGIIAYSGKYRVTNETLEMFAKLKHVQELDIDCCDISSLEPIYDRKMFGLDVGETPLTSSELLRLKHLREIEVITFGPIDKPSAVLSGLSKEKLTYLYYKGALASDNEAKLWRDLDENDVAMIASMPNLSAVGFQDCSEFNDERISQLVPMQSLRSLVIRDCRITPKALIYIEKMPHLDNINLAVDWPAKYKNALLSFARKKGIHVQIDQARASGAVTSNSTKADIAKSFNLEDPALSK
jgi:serine/threonine protein kinase